MSLMSDYEAWDALRTTIWSEESEGWNDYSPDDMGYSDDDGVDLLRRFAEHYEEVLTLVSGLRIGGVVLQGLADLLKLDTASSASRQHYIDTGRYLTEGEAL